MIIGGIDNRYQYSEIADFIETTRKYRSLYFYNNYQLISNFSPTDCRSIKRKAIESSAIVVPFS